jgi:hypothetical protein
MKFIRDFPYQRRCWLKRSPEGPRTGGTIPRPAPRRGATIVRRASACTGRRRTRGALRAADRWRFGRSCLPQPRLQKDFLKSRRDLGPAVYARLMPTSHRQANPDFPAQLRRRLVALQADAGQGGWVSLLFWPLRVRISRRLRSLRNSRRVGPSFLNERLIWAVVSTNGNGQGGRNADLREVLVGVTCRMPYSDSRHALRSWTRAFDATSKRVAEHRLGPHS